MKKLILFFVITCSTQLSGQAPWYKFLPGWTSMESVFQSDTLITTGQVKNGNSLQLYICYSDKETGYIYKCDTIGGVLTGLNNLSLEYRKAQQFIKSESRYLLSCNYRDTQNTNEWKSTILVLNPLNKLLNTLNHATNSTKLVYLSEDATNYYNIVFWEKDFGPTGVVENYRLLKTNKMSLTTSIIHENITPNICTSCHQIVHKEVLLDNTDSRYLILNTEDQWGFHQVPAYFQGELIKLDTTGSVIWKSRPNDNDSFNTSNLKTIQLPNGNILCVWNNLYFTPYKSPRNYQYEDINEECTLWFAEVDNSDGKILWRKNIRQYLDWKIEKGIQKDRQDIIIKDIALQNEKLYFLGNKTRTYPRPVNWKQLPIILNMDLNFDPIYYREIDLFPQDSGDKGVKVKSFSIDSTTSNIYISGEYENRFGQISDGKYWQRSIVIKLDSNSCYTANCNKRDNIKLIKKLKKNISVFPIPTNKKLQIRVNGNPNLWHYSISNTLGKELVKTRKLENTILLNAFPEGLYYIAFVNQRKNQHETYKIIIEH